VSSCCLADAATRLCFFSLPLELLPFYRERVFPAVQDAGFVPVKADERECPDRNSARQHVRRGKKRARSSTSSPSSAATR
jgi:hypothetical protein